MFGLSDEALSAHGARRLIVDGTANLPDRIEVRDDFMIDADLIDGGEIEALIARMFANPKVAYIQAHYAKWGCYAARIDRA